MSSKPSMTNTFADYVLSRLPPDYLKTPDDIAWLGVCSTFHEGDLTNAAVVEATKKATDKYGLQFHCDPIELLIDAKICDTKCNPL